MEKATTTSAKVSLILFVGLFICFSSLAQEIYFVTLVKGDIKKNNATAVKVGDKIPFQEKLVFANKNCKMILLHPQKGRFVVEPGTITPQATGEYFVYLKSSLHLSNEKLKLSSRGDADLDEFFITNPSVNKNLLFVGDTKIALDNSKYLIKDPVNDFFFLQYTPANGKPMNKKLTVTHDSLLISRSDFMFNGAEPAENSEVKIGFMQYYSTEKKMTRIASFSPVFMSIADCKAIIAAIQQTISDKDKAFEEVLTQLYYNYGKPDKASMKLLSEQR
ncbi:MAG TPA: hypothetical protein PLC48_13390 [Ferruginibacter sp.]|nr:hypothetical protein [Ferruginibacter sp.]